MPDQVAYFINEYPKISHSFIRREILALERQGFTIERIALRGWDTDLADEADYRERSRTRYVLKSGATPLLLAMLKTLSTSPARFCRALLLALRSGRHAERSLPYHIAYLAEACLILPWLKYCGVQHVHAHFGNNSTEVVMFARVLGGPPYSFTIHGQEELTSGGLGEKAGRAAFVVAISSFGRGQLYLRTLPSQWKKIQLVHCGLDAAFCDRPPAPVPTTPRLVCVGRLCVEKAPLLLVEAASRLANDKTGFELVFAGDGELRNEVEACIARHGLQSRIRITGWLDSDGIKQEILAARGLILPSFTEGMPIVIMEAMALCRPVLATYVAGVPELVRPGENGWLVPAGDVEKLAAAMREILETPAAELQRMGEAGRRAVMERHSVDTEAAKLAALFRESIRTESGK